MYKPKYLVCFVVRGLLVMTVLVLMSGQGCPLSSQEGAQHFPGQPDTPSLRVSFPNCGSMGAIREGEDVSVSVAVDGGQGPYTVTVDWGDRSQPSTTVAVADPLSILTTAFASVGPHIYATAHWYNVEATAEDALGQTASSVCQVEVYGESYMAYPAYYRGTITYTVDAELDAIGQCDDTGVVIALYEPGSAWGMPVSGAGEVVAYLHRNLYFPKSRFGDQFCDVEPSDDWDSQTGGWHKDGTVEIWNNSAWECQDGDSELQGVIRGTYDANGITGSGTCSKPLAVLPARTMTVCYTLSFSRIDSLPPGLP